MNETEGKLILDLKDAAWLTANADYILDLNEPIYLADGRYSYGDGIKKISELTWFGGPTSSGSTFVNDIVVSLSGGKTYGKYTNGQTIPSAGKTPEQVANLVAIEDIAPTYTIAALSLTKTSTTKAEVGTAYTNTLGATFTKNDAGNLVAIRIQKNGTDIANGTTSPLPGADSGAYVLGNITYIAYADYLAGALKNYTPSNTPDGRTPAVRSTNAPQAAENNFASGSVLLTGAYLQFYGPSSIIPSNSAQVRGMVSNRFEDLGNNFTLNTGTTEINFVACIRANKSISQVIDTTTGFDVTGSFTLRATFNILDAGGNNVSYKVYAQTIAQAYAASHALSITLV